MAPVNVHDKEISALSSRKQGRQERRARNIVPMPQFTDPNNPEANSGSINMSLDGTALQEHPVEHADDYGDGIRGHVAKSGVDPSAREGAGGFFGQRAKDDETPVWPDDLAFPSESDNKDVWEDAAEKCGLSKSGNKSDIIKRVTEFKTAADEAADNDDQ